MMNKKAKVFVLFLVIFAIIALFQIYARFTEKQAVFNMKVGDKQTALIESYQKGERALFYAEQAAKYAVLPAVWRMNQNGGIFNAECGTDSGFVLWKNPEKECMPDKAKIRESIKLFAQNDLDNYLKEYKEVQIPIGSYDYSFVEGDVIGIAAENMLIENGNAKYSVKPSFRVNLGFDMNLYGEIRDKVLNMVRECNGGGDACIERFFGQEESTLPRLVYFGGDCQSKPKRENSVVQLCVKQKISITDKYQQMLKYQNGNPGYEDVEIMFAVYAG